MTNPSDDQPDLNKPADASPTPPPNPSEPTPESDQSDVTRVATPPGSTPPAPTQPMYGQTYGEQPSNAYGGATFDQNPPVPPAPTAGYGQTPPPPTYGGQPGYGQAPYGAPAAYSAQVGTPDSGATTAMVLGIIGLAGGFFCGLPIVLSPFALFMGLSAKKRIDAAAGALTGRGNAQAGFILGIIGTVLLVLSIVAITIVIIIGVSGGFDDPSGYDSGYDSYDSEF